MISSWSHCSASRSDMQPDMYVSPSRAVLATLKAGLREAEVLELPPGASFKQRSSLVVLRGTLRATGRAPSLPTADPEEPGTQSKCREFLNIWRDAVSCRSMRFRSIYMHGAVVPWLCVECSNGDPAGRQGAKLAARHAAKPPSLRNTMWFMPAEANNHRQGCIACNRRQ